MGLNQGTGAGWIPDPPRPNAPTRDAPEIANLLGKASIGRGKTPPRVSHRDYFPAAFDTFGLHASAANAVAAALAYYDRVVTGEESIPSRLFLYKVARNLAGSSIDNGASIGATIEALTRFGTVPELLWPYDPSLVDVEPPAFCYAYAMGFRASGAFRHDPEGAKPEAVLDSVKSLLANGFPTVFGFLLFGSAGATADVPMPVQGDPLVGSLAVVAVGYDDDHEAQTTDPETKEPKTLRGAIEFRNAWGPGWGDEGHGWLPYEYVAAGLTGDWWTILRADDLGAQAFGTDAVQKRPKPAPPEEAAPEPTPAPVPALAPASEAPAPAPTSTKKPKANPS